MKIMPLNERVVLKMKEQEELTAGGLFLPNTAKEKPEFAEVIAVDTGIEKVKKGDLVLISKYSGTEVKLEGVEYIIVKEEDILAKIEK